ncbi:MAG TPA: RnfABCDGE type electron transport complex subunit D [bacterium]|nr:RnfABCDGE type electron transport complex subunit D [bacterium]
MDIIPKPRSKDPRVYQILFLGILLLSGALLRDFSIGFPQVLLTFAAGLATQGLFLRLLKIPQAGYLSALVTCLGVATLLRADNLWVHPLAVFLALSAKFLLRVRGKHVYNPTNLAVMLGLTLLPGAWASAGQWGNDMALAAWILTLGGTVVNRAGTRDISWTFLGFYFLLLSARVLYLGQPASVLLHALETGSLIHFAFFMISDPVTSPNHRAAKVLHCLLVAAGAFLWQYGLYRVNGLYWALFAATTLVPLWDLLLPGPKYQWKKEKEDGKVQERQKNVGGGLVPAPLGGITPR